MLSKLLKNPLFNVTFSFLLGLGVVALVRPLCKDGECTVKKAPPVKEWDGAVYRVGNKCHEYKTKSVECPASGMIESFRGEAVGRESSTALSGTLPQWK